MKKEGSGWRIAILLVILVIVIGVIAVERIFPERIHKNNYIDSVEELNLKISDELKNGHTSFRTYLEGMGEAELANVNRNVDGFLGYVKSYSVLKKVNKNVLYVNFTLAVSDNYYAYQSVVNGENIDAHKEATLLAIKVKQIIDQYKSESEYQTVVNYHDYIVKNTKYGFLSGEEEIYSYTAYGALIKGTAVCNGYAEAMELLLLCSGMETHMAIGNTTEGPHAWNIVNVEGNWYHVDTTWDDPVPDMGDNIVHVYLNVDDSIMSKTHSWNENAYPECTHMEMNYYEHEKLAFNDIDSVKGYILDNMKNGKFEIMVHNVNVFQPDIEQLMRNGKQKQVEWRTFEDTDYKVYYFEFTDK